MGGALIEERRETNTEEGGSRVKNCNMSEKILRNHIINYLPKIPIVHIRLHIHI